MKVMKKLFLLIFLSIFSFSNSFAEYPHFIDFSKVLNNSKAGADAQKKLKTKFESESKKYKKQEDDIRKEEANIISNKKILKTDEYQKKVQELRKKVADLQKNKKESLTDLSSSRSKAKQSLLTAVNPIIKEYMKVNKIRLVLDKKAILMGDTNLEITSQIIDILNKEVTTLNLK